MSARRVAVIGGGAAGLGAAWSLARAGVDVTVFEREPVAGGHMLTLDLTLDGERVTFEAGVQAIGPRVYPNTVALARLLGVELRPVSEGYTVASPDGGLCGTSHLDTPLWRELERECVRFTLEAEDLVALNSVEVISCSIGEYLRTRGYSDRFIWLMDSLGALIGQESGHELETTVLFYAMGVVSGLVSFFQPAPGAMTFVGGMRALVDALARPLDGRVHVGRGAARVRREPGAARVTDLQGVAARFDDVVFAVDGLLALAMLEDPTPLEENLLGGCQMQFYGGVLHGDESVLIPGIADGLRTSVEVNADQVATFNVTRFERGRVARPLLVTFSDQASIDAAKVHRRFAFRTGKDNTYSFEVKKNLHRIQGRDRLWYAGEWTFLSTLEGALVSGLVVAEALGAPFPFARDPRAARGYEIQRALMREGRESFSLLG